MTKFYAMAIGLAVVLALLGSVLFEWPFNPYVLLIAGIFAAIGLWLTGRAEKLAWLGTILMFAAGLLLWHSGNLWTPHAMAAGLGLAVGIMFNAVAANKQQDPTARRV